jgi:serine/threonine protein kinase
MWKRFVTLIGAGTLGEVWHAEYHVEPTQAAVKLSFRRIDDQFVQEELDVLKHVVSLQHPAIIDVRNVSVIDDKLLVGTELAEQNLLDRLHQCLSRATPFPILELVLYLRQIAEGLDHLHRCRVIHGGVNPTDILLSAGNAKIADFGPLLVPDFTKRFRVTVPFYKSACMAPEFKRGEPTNNSDQFALAATYVWMRQGHPFFASPNESTEIDMIPQPERDVLQIALDQDPTQRFPTCCQFVESLKKSIAAKS